MNWVNFRILEGKRILLLYYFICAEVEDVCFMTSPPPPPFLKWHLMEAFAGYIISSSDSDITKDAKGHILAVWMSKKVKIYWVFPFAWAAASTQNPQITLVWNVQNRTWRWLTDSQWISLPLFYIQLDGRSVASITTRAPARITGDCWGLFLSEENSGIVKNSTVK